MLKVAELPTPCGIANLLAAVFFLPADRVKQRLGLPSEQRLCLNCGQPITSKNEQFCNRTCQRQYTLIPLVCDECGGTFYRGRSIVVADLGRNRHKHTFCNRRCVGAYAGKHYGWPVHKNKNTPRRSSSESRGRKRKWDYEQVMMLRKLTGWGATKLS